jgi:hypothetical protein
MERTFDLAMRGREPTRAPVRPPTRQHVAVRQRLQDLAAALERADEPQAGAALRVRLYDREHEQDRGIGW